MNKIKLLTIAMIAFCTVFAYGQRNHSKDAKSKIENEVVGKVIISEVRLPEGNKPLELRSLRLRTLDVFPAGIVGLHTHENRPAILGIVRGKGFGVHSYKEAMEEALFGQATLEYNNFIHWGYNMSKTDTLTLITFDLLEDGSAQNGKVYPQHTPLLDKLKAEDDPFYRFAPKTHTDDVSTQLFKTNIQDIKFPKGKAPLVNRQLRIRRVTLPAGTTTGVQDYSNRPSYIIVLNGTIEVKKLAENSSAKLLPLKAANLVNTGNVEVKNTSNQEAVYFVTELWDPADKRVL